MNLNRRIRTTLHDDQLFSDFETDLLHTPALQRLYDLHQLGFTDRIFVDASHGRLHHVIGVVEQANKIITAIVRNLRKVGSATYSFGDEHPGQITSRELARLTERRRPSVRLMALLHDLTHAPYGHTLEDEISLVPEGHDEPGRQADAFYRLVVQYLGWVERNESRRPWGAPNSRRPADDDAVGLLDHYMDAPDINEPPAATAFINASAARWARLITAEPEPQENLRRLSGPALGVSLRHLDFAIRALLHLQSAHKNPDKIQGKHIPASTYPVLQLLEAVFSAAEMPLRDDDRFNPNRDAYLLDVIGNTICADLLDYAQRDSAQAGLKLAYDPQRIIGNMTVVGTKIVRHEVDTAEGPKRFPFNNESLRTAVSIFSHKLRLDVPGELLNLLQVRFYVYERVLFHPTKCVAGAMLGAAMQNIGWKTLPRHWAHVGDTTLLREARDSARFLRDFLDSIADQNGFFGSDHVDMLRTRLNGFPVSGLTAAVRDWVNDRGTLTREEVLSNLDVITTVERYSNAAKAIRGFLNEKQDRIPKHLGAAEWPKWRTAFENAASSRGVDGIAVVQLLFPTISRVREQVVGGIRLLDRLAARRYHKVVFRLLANAPSTNGTATDLTPEKITRDFQDPLVRKYVEWEIADEAKLPRGSVVIHCPPAKGPTKIANILMTDGKSPEHPKLRDISVLDKHIFKDHQAAVTTLENMYQSTWRLAVSVAPPFDAKWPDLQPIIGRALYRALGGAGELSNDRHMIRELEGQAKAVREIHERDLAASRRIIAGRDELAELGERVLDLLDEMDAAQPSDPSEAINELRPRLRAGEGATDLAISSGDTQQDGLKPRWRRQKDARITLEENFGQIWKSTGREIEIYRRMVGLTPEKQQWLEARLSGLRTPANVQDNRLSTPAEKAQVLSRIEQLITEAESIE
jgi:HD superfamily phosphohydrolase